MVQDLHGAGPTRSRCPRTFQRRNSGPTVYDNQTRSMLDTPQRYPRAGNQSYPTPPPIRDRVRRQIPETDAVVWAIAGLAQASTSADANNLFICSPIEPWFRDGSASYRMLKGKARSP